MERARAGFSVSPLRTVRAQRLDRRPPGVAGAVAGLGLRERAVQSNLNRRARPTRGHRQSLLRLVVTRGSSCMPRATHAPIPRTILTARVPAIEHQHNHRCHRRIGIEVEELRYHRRLGCSSSRIRRPRSFRSPSAGNFLSQTSVHVPFRSFRVPTRRFVRASVCRRYCRRWCAANIAKRRQVWTVTGRKRWKNRVVKLSSEVRRKGLDFDGPTLPTAREPREYI